MVRKLWFKKNKTIIYTDSKLSFIKDTFVCIYNAKIYFGKMMISYKIDVIY